MVKFINSLKCIFVFSKGFCEVSGPQLVLIWIFWYPSVSPVSGGRREEGGDCCDVSSPGWSAVTWRLHCRHWVDRPGQAGNKYFKYFTSFSHLEKLIASSHISDMAGPWGVLPSHNLYEGERFVYIPVTDDKHDQGWRFGWRPLTRRADSSRTRERWDQ